MSPTDAFGNPIGEALPGWTPRLPPPRSALTGRYCRVEPLDPDRHATALFRAFAADRDGRVWTYLAYGPFATAEEYGRWAAQAAASRDPLFHAIVDSATGEAQGVASYLRIEPAVGVIEVGHIALAPTLQRTRAATEAMYLLMRRAFDELGYRRFEWKCDALNARSRAAALRLGLGFEGIFRQATIYKGRNRDTAWFALVDRDWPRARAAFEAWLDPANFTDEGRQRRSLANIREATMRQVMFIEIGQGADLQGEDATKAAIRAVRDAIGRNYLPGMRQMIEAGKGPMLVHVRLGVPPEIAPADLDAVRATLPHGEVTVEQRPGGMLAPSGHGEGGRICVVDAVVEVAVAGGV